jgi:hypothetical protein
MLALLPILQGSFSHLTADTLSGQGLWLPGKARNRVLALAAMVHARLERQNEKFLARLKRVEEKRQRDELLAAGGGEPQLDDLALALAEEAAAAAADDEAALEALEGLDGSGTVGDGHEATGQEQEQEHAALSGAGGGAAAAVTFAETGIGAGVVVPPPPPSLEADLSRAPTPAPADRGRASRKPAHSADLKKKIALIRR